MPRLDKEGVPKQELDLPGIPTEFDLFQEHFSTVNQCVGGAEHVRKLTV